MITRAQPESKVQSLLRTVCIALTLLVVAPACARAQAIAVEDATAPDPADRPLTIRIWHPARLESAAPVPLIVISHGTGGSLFGHTDTAFALARAGFVVAAVSHTGDNYQDQSYVALGTHLMGRPRHISRVIDYVTEDWSGHTHVDGDLVGVFGHSAGGFTALVLAGGTPDMSLGEAHCREFPDAWDCAYLRRHGFDFSRAPQWPPSAWQHDARVKAAVVAAPAVGYAFMPDRLSRVNVPLQLWAAEHDSVVDDSPAIIGRLLPRPPDYRVVEGASHFSFIAPCSERQAAAAEAATRTGESNYCADPDGFDRVAFHREFNAAVVEFFVATLSRREASDTPDAASKK